jgi:acetyl-CoA acetyltransferase
MSEQRSDEQQSNEQPGFAVVPELTERNRHFWQGGAHGELVFAQAHMDRYGTTEEQLAQIARNARRNAALNPKTIYRDPMSLED